MAMSTRGNQLEHVCIGVQPGKTAYSAVLTDKGKRRPSPAMSISRADQLRLTIESEIIPRLMLVSHGGGAVEPSSDQARESSVSGDDVLELTSLLLAGDSVQASALIGRLIDGGASRFGLLLDLLAPTAKRLGELWENDVADFFEVTVAVGFLQQWLRRFELDEALIGSNDLENRSVLLAPVSGEQHTFPIQILEAFFRREGWSTELCLGPDLSGAIRKVKRVPVDVIGLSMSRDDLLDQLALDIECLRKASCKSSMVVLVGGRAFAGRPELVKRVGADATADDARSAVSLAERLVSVAVNERI